MLETLKAEILENGLAVYGADETMDAAKDGKVSILLVNEGVKIAGWKCEKCQVAGIGAREKCPYCGRETTKVDIIEEIVELAERSDARVEFFNSKMLHDIGDIAALLRYK